MSALLCMRCGADLDPELPGARCARCFPAPVRVPDPATSTNLGRFAIRFTTTQPKGGRARYLRELREILRRGQS